MVRFAKEVAPRSRQFTRHAPFVDRVKCLLASGTGGDGAVMFTHLPNLEFAGPSGANGGRGGSIIAECSREFQDLDHIKSMGPSLTAGRGANGGPLSREGTLGEDLVLTVPPGTVVTDIDTNRVALDVDEIGLRTVLLEGGKGGRGNASFKNALLHAPTEATKGTPGNTMLAEIELKMIADVGLVGFPNAGKSSLLSAISSAKPKVAPFPFATLHPTIGVLRNLQGETCDVADLPGLIEGAYENRGLGHQFLRHVERNHGIALVVDMFESYTPPDRDEPQPPWEVVDTLLDELEFYLPGLSERALVVFANKMDMPRDVNGQDMAQKFAELQRRTSLRCFPVSAEAGMRDGSMTPRSGLKPAVEFMTQTIWEKKRKLAAERERVRQQEAEELARVFRDKHPEYFTTAGSRMSDEYDVHYVGKSALQEDMRYHKERHLDTRTKAMLERRRQKAGKAGSEFDDADLREAIGAGGSTRGTSLVDQQLEAIDGASGLGTNRDPYFDLNSEGRAGTLRDLRTGTDLSLLRPKRKPNRR